VAGGWRRLHNEELHNLYTSLYITGAIKSRRMGCAVNVSRMGGWPKNLKERDRSEFLVVDGKILEWILDEKVVKL
jgi:hypothetical protein